jgi:hypothetical protein
MGFLMVTMAVTGTYLVLVQLLLEADAKGVRTLLQIFVQELLIGARGELLYVTQVQAR